MKKATDAFVFAFNGLRYAFVNERNFRIEMIAATAVCIAAYMLHISAIEWLVVVINIGFVISAELINAAIEKLCDLVTKENDPSIKIIKDVAAGAVLLAAFVAVICGLVIFVPAFLKLLNH
ncbi:MAG: diacylglycerol kinase family protein [Ferruginibacter sp.]